MSQRLGIAAALLGDPQILMFDEPVNGLDPEGIVWIRTLMRSLAAEGRTVLVSSHLMPEMENTADHLIVIGRGKLIADCSMADFVARGSARRSWSAPRSEKRLPSQSAAAGGIATKAERGRAVRPRPHRGTDRRYSLSLTASGCTTWRRRRPRWNRRSWSSPPTAWNTTRMPAPAGGFIRNGGRTMTAVTHAAGATGAQTRRGAGPDWRARSARSSPRSARSGPPTGRWRCWCWPASPGASRSVRERRRTGRTCRQPGRTGPDPEQHHRAGPARAAGHRRARRAGDHLGVLDPGDPHVADGDAAARDPVRGQGRSSSRLVAPRCHGPGRLRQLLRGPAAAGRRARGSRRCRSQACCGRSWPRRAVRRCSAACSATGSARSPEHRRDHHHGLRNPATAAAARQGAAHALVSTTRSGGCRAASSTARSPAADRSRSVSTCSPRGASWRVFAGYTLVALIAGRDPAAPQGRLTACIGRQGAGLPPAPARTLIMCGARGAGCGTTRGRQISPWRPWCSSPARARSTGDPAHQAGQPRSGRHAGAAAEVPGPGLRRGGGIAALQVFLGLQPHGAAMLVAAFQPTATDVTLAILLYTLAAHRPRRTVRRWA